MLKHIEILTAEKKTGVGSKSGKPFEFLALQGLMVFDDGRQEVFVYDYWPKRGEPCPDLKPGRYLPVLEPKANVMTRKLEANIVELRPVELKRAA